MREEQPTTDKPRTDFGYLGDAGGFVPITGAGSTQEVVKHLRDNKITGDWPVFQFKGMYRVKITATAERVDDGPAPVDPEPDPEDVVNPILDEA